MTGVTIANSENVADRLFSFYTATNETSMDMVVTTQRPGDLLNFKDPFYDQTTAYLKSLDINHSRTLKAAANLITGYVPVSYGNFFTQSIRLTGSGTWTVPEGKTKIRAILIAAGIGGRAGMYGTKGTSGGTGGEGSEGGKGGRILNISLDVTPGQEITFACGVKGTGGVKFVSVEVSGLDLSCMEGTEGTDTTFGAYTSASGVRLDNGFLDVFSGNRYAYKGDIGLNGGPGATTSEPNPTFYYKGVT
jgi:hypothetical protein